MLNKFIIASVSIFLTNLAHGDKLYQMKDSTGTTILTSKPDKYKSMVVEKFTSYPTSNYLYEDTPDGKKYIEIMYGADRRSKTIATYKKWIDTGKSNSPPLIPEKVTKELVFLPLIIAKVKSGNALIGEEQKTLDFIYENHTSCIGDKSKNLKDFRKKTSFNLNKNIVFPNDTKVDYGYKCISTLIDVHSPIISQTELDKELKFIRNYENRMNSKRENGNQQPKAVHPDGIKSIAVTITGNKDSSSTDAGLEKLLDSLEEGFYKEL